MAAVEPNDANADSGSYAVGRGNQWEDDKGIMTAVSSILDSARMGNRHALSEYESKKILAVYGIPVVEETLASDWEEVEKAAAGIGYPVALKLCAARLAHKTEKGLIDTHLRNAADLRHAFSRLEAPAEELGARFLVQRMVSGSRELVIGMNRDRQFGPCVLFGLGGVFTEVLNDVAFRAAPIEMEDALEMMREISGRGILDAVRGMPAADKPALARSLVALGKIALENESIEAIDVNPVIIEADRPVAVDALIELNQIREGG